MRAQILVVEDDAAIAASVVERLKALGHRVDHVVTGEEALVRVDQDAPDLLLLDLNLPGMGGMEVLAAVRRQTPAPSVVVLTAYGDIRVAVEAMRLGANDFLTKPFEVDHLEVAIDKALEQVSLTRTNTLLHAELNQHSRPQVAEGPAMTRVLALADKVAPTTTTVLLLGESGTGKEVIARRIHRSSKRSGQPFVPANCAAMPAELIESQLFGHERGAFTGASRNHKGLFEVADGGTLFLDEIGELPLGLQPKLLRVLQEQRFTRVGGTREICVDVRILAATNLDLDEAVEGGEFREDLYYRLNVVSITVPPLRQRSEDVVSLAERFLERYCAELHRPQMTFSDEAMELLRRHAWPGNVRELENAIERAVVLADGPAIIPSDLPDAIARGEQRGDPAGVGAFVSMGFHDGVKEFKRQLLEAALERHGGVQVDAANTLGLHPTYLSRLLKNLEVR